MGKRVKRPNKVPEQTNKHIRVQKKSQPSPQRNLRKNEEEKSGRPGPSSYQAPQDGLHLHHHPVQLPSQQPEQGGRRRPRLRLNPPKPQKLPSSSQTEPTDPRWSYSQTSTCYSQDVATYDVGRGVKAVGIPQAEDIEYWGSTKGAAEFIRSHSGLGEDWVGVRPLGKGGYGLAGLWELRGDDGQIIKQVVVKEETYTRSNWRKYKANRDVPNEVKVMSMLNKRHCHAIPRLFNYKRYAHAYKHRIYMEFCPFKDLSVLCKRYRRFRQYLPEPFLWDTFYHLVNAAATMKHGPKGVNKKYEIVHRDLKPFLWDTFYRLVNAAATMKHGPKGVNKKYEIVHRDLKPANVFLGEENPEKGFPFYPVAKLGDYGLAVTTNSEDLSNPHNYRGPGTRGYKAPEQLKDGTPEKDQHQLSSYTNVWAIGATMLELLTLYPHADFVNDPEYHVNGVITNIDTTREPEYSKDLRDLIKRCIEPDPFNRIPLHRLRASIRSYRKRISRAYRESGEEGKARFRSDNRLYYIRNEINNMPTGNWQPYEAKSPSEPESGRFPDRDFPVVFPRFDDGPEGEGDEGDDGDADDGPEREGDEGDDGDSDDGDDDGDADDVPRPGPLESIPRQDAVTHSPGHRLSIPILTPDDTEETDDESQDMELETEEPPSPTPPRRRRARARASHQVQALAPPAASAAAPATQRVPRRLRNGKIIGYF